MKKLFCFLFVLFTLAGHSQIWVNAGVSNFSGGYADNIRLATGGSTLYAAYRDFNNNYGATVKKFDGTNWLTVGNPNFSDGQTDFVSLAMDGSTPYVAYMDYNNNGATVKTFDATNWVDVGPPGFSAGYAENISLAMNGSTPYVAYLDYDNYYAVTVKTFDDTNWVNVGTPGFSEGYADNISLSIISDTLYVAYMDYDNYYSIVIKKFDGTNWINVGTPGFTGNQADNINLVTDGTSLYIAYRDYNYYGVAVKKFDGTDWADVGNPNVSGGYADYISVAISGATPYVAYMDYAYSGATVKTFDGTSWVAVGAPAFSDGQADYLKLVINDSIPLVAYLDNNSGGVSGKQFDANTAPPPATGLKFDGGDDYVNCGNNASINNLGLNGFTLEAWVKLSNPYTTNSIIRKTGDYNLYVNGGKLNVEYWPNGVGNSSFSKLSGTITIAANTWTHVAATWDGTTASLYVNGVLNNGSSFSTLIGGTENLWLGRSSIYNNPYGGSMDEIRIWNRALCQSEIQNNRTGELDTSIQNGLMAYYKFNQGTVGANNTGVTTVADASGNGNNGILNNFSLAGINSNWVAGTVTGNAPIFVPSTLSGIAGGAQVCQSGAVHTGATYYNDGNCSLIAGVYPSGASPVTGTVNTCVKIDATVQSYNGKPYVQRHYDITPVINAATATATITLYYTQAEFDAYNLVRGINPALPTGSGDVTGIANLLITQYHGNGTAPGNYTGSAALINPADNKIIWNSSSGRWEITFDVNGFSGFYVYTSNTNSTLPLQLLSFSGNKSGSSNQLQWATSNEINTKEFSVEKSTNGRSFSSIGIVVARGNAANHYDYTDNNPFADNNYYRLKMTDNDGRFTYSNIIKLTNQPVNYLTIYPNPVKDKTTLQISDKKLFGTTVKIMDANGRMVKRFSINNNFEIVDMSGLPPGLYMLQLSNGVTQKLVKE